MKRFFRLFGTGKPANWNGRVFLPVVHLQHGKEMETGMAGASTAYGAGADGVFLIEHSGNTDYRYLTEVVANIRESFTRNSIAFPIGVNYLSMAHEPDIPIYEAMRLGEIPMIWSDNPGGRQYVEGARVRIDWPGVYFGAVAFKYQKPVPLDELPEVAQQASWMDVLTTSGEKTGVQIELDRARVFARVPNSIRAVASGVSIENVDQLLPYFQAFLVASSIARDFHHLDYEKTRKLANAIHSWKSRS